MPAYSARSGGGAVPGSYEVPPAPPWSKVIGTTLRLWLRRRVLRVPDGPAADQLVRRRALAAGLVVLIVAAAAAAGFSFARQQGAGGRRPAVTTGLSQASVAAAQNRGRA